MIDDTTLNTVAQNLSIADTDEAFAGAMPVGEVSLVSVATTPKTLNGNNWYPVTFRSGNDTYELSLKGLLQAEGLTYTKRNLKERIRMWYALADASAAKKKFNYNGKASREITYKKDFRDFDGVEHHKGEKGTMKIHSFASKQVG